MYVSHRPISINIISSFSASSFKTYAKENHKQSFRKKGNFFKNFHMISKDIFIKQHRVHCAQNQQNIDQFF